MIVAKVELRRERVDLAEVAREAAVQASGDLARSGSQLSLDLAAVHGRWDRLRLEQVVTNLLVNASKFGQGKPIQLFVRPDGSRARLVVTDGGIGMSHDAQRRVFERFARAVPSRNFGGLGLGLYIARQIVEAHGGLIEVASEPGAGATFTVELPLEGRGRRSRRPGRKAGFSRQPSAISPQL